MAISTIIYSNANTKSKTVTVDFLADLLSSSSNGTSDEIKYFFKFSTDAKDEDGLSYHIKVIEDYEECLGCENETMCEQCANNVNNNY